MVLCRGHQKQWETYSSSGQTLGWAIWKGSKTCNGWTLDDAVWGNLKLSLILWLKGEIIRVLDFQTIWESKAKRRSSEKFNTVKCVGIS
jgi:hypothetical protein